MAQGPIGVNILSKIVGIGGSNVSPFGDIITVEPSPEVQLDFVYGINSQTGTSSTANGGTVDVDTTRLRLQSGTNAAGSATFESERIARYRPGAGLLGRFTGAWSASAADSTQVIGIGTSDNGYFFGYNGTSFGISRRIGGSDNWVAQTSWNGDTCDGNGGSGFTWDKTYGNVMQIMMPYLGYGNITFWVMDSATSEWILCHTIKYTNSSSAVQVSNPSFRFHSNITNTGNTSNLTTFTGSCSIYITGKKDYLGAQWAIDSLKNTITTEENLLNIRNCSTYNTFTNLGVIRLRSLSCSTDNGNGLATIRFKKGVSLGGSPSFTTINGSTADNGVTITSGNSIASYDVAGTGTSGTLFFNVCLSRNSNMSYDLTPFDLFINPGETLSVTAFSAASASIEVALNWNEDV